MATRIEKTDLARDALYDKVNTMIDEVNTKIDNKDSLPSQTGNAGKFLTTDGTNASWGEVKQIEIEQDLTNPTIDTVPSTKAVKDESSRITTLMNTKVSNCITEIPQDIKLELNNGTLTLKAGSKVYVPNGFEADGATPKFDEVVIENDITITSTLNRTAVLTINTNTMKIGIYADSMTFSGNTAPSDQQYMQWYDTANNLVKQTNNNGSTWTSGFSLPFAMVTITSVGIQSINQVFNGFGYIGSTIYALPGVKGRIPNGRNADGSLKSIESTLDKVLTETFPNLDVPVYVTLKTNSLDYWQVAVTPIAYSETENFFINGLNIKSSELILGISYLSSGKITSFAPKTVFHALDYNDKSTISGWSMPSSRYIDLTLGASGSRYTAPANGWFCVAKRSGGTNQYLGLISNGLEVTVYYNSGMVARNFIPCKKGSTITVNYNMSGNTEFFRFIFAEGESYNPISSSSESGGQEGGETDWGE